jgi:hypothetical protein
MRGNTKSQGPSSKEKSKSHHQNNVRPIEILGLGFVWDLVSWDLGFLT